jgi:hypothetical protein
MKNVTITLDEEVAAWARVHAARQDMSVSRMIGEMLEQRMQESAEYEESMRRFLARKPIKVSRGRARYPTREALHDRSRLR